MSESRVSSSNLCCNLMLLSMGMHSAVLLHKDAKQDHVLFEVLIPRFPPVLPAIASLESGGTHTYVKTLVLLEDPKPMRDQSLDSIGISEMSRSEMAAGSSKENFAEVDNNAHNSMAIPMIKCGGDNG